MLRLNTSERIKIILIDSLGSPKTGLVATDFKSSSVYLYKSTGVKTTIALTLGVNLFETDSTDAPGVYEIILTTTHTNTLGMLAISIQPATSAFIASYFTETVEDTVTNISTLIGTPVVSVSTDIASVYSRLGTPAGVNMSADIAAVKVDTASIKLDTAATVTKLPASTISAATDITTAVSSIKGVSTIDNTQIYNRIGAPTGASVSADIASIKSDTGSILTTVGTINTTTGTTNTTVNSIKVDTTTILTDIGNVSTDVTSVLADTAIIKADTTILKADTTILKADTTTIKADTAATVAVLPLTTIAAATDVTTSTSAIKGADNRSITDIAGVGTFNLATDTLHDIKASIGGFATTADVNAARDSIKGPDGRDLTQLAGAGFVSASDSHVALKAAITAISGATAAAIFEELLALHMTPNTFGEFMNILSAIMLNRVRIDKLTKTLTVFQADNITPLKTYPLYDLNGNPALLNASERGKGI